MPDFLREEDAVTRRDDRRHAGHLAGRRKPREVEVGQPAHERFVLELDPGERAGHVDREARQRLEQLRTALGLAQQERAVGRDPDRVDQCGRILSPQLDLAEKRQVADAAGSCERARERRGLPRREAVICARGTGGEERELGHDLSRSPAGSKNGRRRTRACSSRPFTRISNVASSSARSGGSHARPIALPTRSLQRALVTRPLGRPSRTTWPPSAGTVPFAITKPTSSSRGPRSCACSIAHLPTKSSLSSFAIQVMLASSTFDSESVSWPTMMCCFSRRRMRCASRPNGFAARSSSTSQRYSPYGLAKCSSYPSSPTKPMRSIRHGTPATRPSFASRYLKPPAARSVAVRPASGSRACGPATLSAASAPVRLTISTSSCHTAFHHSNQPSTLSAPVEVVVT